MILHILHIPCAVYLGNNETCPAEQCFQHWDLSQGTKLQLLLTWLSYRDIIIEFCICKAGCGRCRAVVISLPLSTWPHTKPLRKKARPLQSRRNSSAELLMQYKAKVMWIQSESWDFKEQETIHHQREVWLWTQRRLLLMPAPSYQGWDVVSFLHKANLDWSFTMTQATTRWTWLRASSWEAACQHYMFEDTISQLS